MVPIQSLKSTAISTGKKNTFEAAANHLAAQLKSKAKRGLSAVISTSDDSKAAIMKKSKSDIG